MRWSEVVTQRGQPAPAVQVFDEFWWQYGTDPEQWRLSLEPISVDDWITAHLWTGEEWMPAELTKLCTNIMAAEAMADASDLTPAGEA